MISTAPPRLAGLRVVVTGASGFVGSHLVERLSELGATVGALSRTRGRLDQLGDARFDYLQCDLTDAAATREVITGFAPHTLLHFASRPDAHESFEHTKDSLDVNAVGTLNALDALKTAGGKVIVYGDSCKVYGANAEVPYREQTPTVPNSTYAISKLAGWQICQLYGRLHNIAAVTVRPTLMHGPRQSYNLFSFIVDRIRKHESDIPLDGGRQTRDPLFVSDAVDAVLTAAERAPDLAGRVINIGGGSETTVERLAQLVVELSGSRAVVVCRPDRVRPTEMWRSYCDNKEAEMLLGWRPRTPLAAALRQTIDYLMDEHCNESSLT